MEEDFTYRPFWGNQILYNSLNLWSDPYQNPLASKNLIKYNYQKSFIDKQKSTKS